MEGWKTELLQRVQELRSKIEESWRLRAAIFSAVAVCVLVILMACSGEGSAQDEMQITMGKVQTGESSASKANAKEVLGMKEAAAKEALGNPFLPSHPTVSQPNNLPKTPKAKVGAVARAVPSNPLPAATGAKAQMRNVQLQGIINEGGNVGALISIDGNMQLLLAGESYHGCYVDCVGQDEAHVSVDGAVYNLHVGESTVGAMQRENG